MGSRYRVNLDQHLSVLRDREVFYGIILVKAHSLMEAHGKYVRYIMDVHDHALIFRLPSDDEIQKIYEVQLAGGIEIWGDKLLKDMNRDWQIVDGKSGLVQTSVIRNVIAHGYPRVTKEMASKAAARGATMPYAVGEDVLLTFEQCRQHLARIKSFCRRLDGGIINLAKRP